MEDRIFFTPASFFCLKCNAFKNRNVVKNNLKSADGQLLMPFGGINLLVLIYGWVVGKFGVFRQDVLFRGKKKTIMSTLMFAYEKLAKQ